MFDVRKLIPLNIKVSPLTLACPKCKAVPGESCGTLNKFEMIHLERIEAAAVIDRASRKSRHS